MSIFSDKIAYEFYSHEGALNPKEIDALSIREIIKKVVNLDDKKIYKLDIYDKSKYKINNSSTSFFASKILPEIRANICRGISKIEIRVLFF